LNIVSASNENYQVEIYNITGQKVKYSNTQKQIDLSDLSDGSYIYVIKNKTGEVIQKEKFVIAE
ncbi:MAG: T9SS C-terminal target domain-containing protein, partial [Bacteroidetes bacterium]